MSGLQTQNYRVQYQGLTSHEQPQSEQDDTNTNMTGADFQSQIVIGTPRVNPQLSLRNVICVLRRKG